MNSPEKLSSAGTTPNKQVRGADRPSDHRGWPPEQPWLKVRTGVAKSPDTCGSHAGIYSFMPGAIFFVSRSGFFADFSNIKVHLLEPTREEILAQNKPNENGTYSYVITNDLKGDFTEDEFVTFIQNRFVNLKITCDFTYGFSSEQIGFGIILQFPLD